jgi:uncharacterized phage protein (TIGR02218 family)
MTAQRVSQAGAEALLRVTPTLDVSQAGIEYLHRVGTPMNVGQAGAEYLHRVTPVFSITQAGVEFLHKHVPCGTRLAQVWTITRSDGEVFRFTSRDTDLTWRGQTYMACDSLVPSASEAVSRVDEAGSMDLSGAIGDDGISEHDLYAGLFDGATIEAWLVPWAGEGSAKRLLGGTFGAVEQSPTGFNVEVLGDGAKLLQTPLVRTLKPGCGYQFGDPATCRKDMTGLAVAGTVDTGIGQREFTDAARAETAGYFSRGRVTFTTGANAGISAEIKDHLAGGVFQLWPRLPFVAAAGDQYSMVPGCTNLKAASGGTNGCTAWDNFVNYGGEPDVPTKDKLTAAAVVKT